MTKNMAEIQRVERQSNEQWTVCADVSSVGEVGVQRGAQTLTGCSRSWAWQLVSLHAIQGSIAGTRPRIGSALCGGGCFPGDSWHSPDSPDALLNRGCEKKGP